MVSEEYREFLNQQRDVLARHANISESFLNRLLDGSRNYFNSTLDSLYNDLKGTKEGYWSGVKDITDEYMFISILYDLCNSKHFSMPLYSEDMLYNPLSLNQLPDLSFLFDFEELGCFVIIRRCDFEIDIKGSFHKIYKVILKSKEEAPFLFQECYYVPEMSSKLLYIAPLVYVGMDIPEIEDFRLRRESEELVCPIKVCEATDCTSVRSCPEVGINKLIDICLYGIDVYANRGIGLNKVILQSLLVEEKQEGKSKTVKVSKHHNSPVTHYRKGHYRHYKGGKRKWVKGTVVNDDKFEG